jgi:hypothetical protein
MAEEVDTYVVDASGRRVILKDPDAELDYTWNWTDYLAQVGDVIAAIEIVLDDSIEHGLTVESSGYNDTHVTAWISGGRLPTDEDRALLRVTCRITTDNTPPRIDDRSIYLKIKQR